MDLDRETPFPVPELLAKIDGLRILRGTPEDPEALKQRASAVHLVVVSVGAAGDDALSALSRVRRLAPLRPVLVVVADEAAERRVLKLGPHECVLRDTASRSVLLRFIRRGLARGRLADSNPAAAPTPGELSTLISSARELLQLEDCGQVASMAVAAGKRLTGAISGIAVLVDRRGEPELFAVDEPGRPGHIPEAVRTSFKAVAQLAASAGTAFDNAFASSQLAGLLPIGHSQVDTMLLAPLRTAEASVGFVALGNKPGGFDERDGILATLLGEIVATSVELCRSNKAQRATSRQQRALIDQVGSAIVAADVEGEISLWTAAAERTFGWSSEEMMGKPLGSFASPATGGRKLGRRSDGSEVELHPIDLGADADAGEAWTPAALSTGTAYEISCTPASFGALRRLAGAPVQASRDGAPAIEACYRVLHGRGAPCADCPAALPADAPSPRFVVRRPKEPDGFMELVTAELVEGSTARITVQRIAERALGVLLQARAERLAAGAGLSDREREVLTQLVMGRTLEEIGAALGISTRTVKFHQTNALEKLGADSRLDVMRLIL